MKKSNLLITSLLMVAVVITCCTKTEDPVEESLKKGEATLARIMDFKSLMEEAKANPDAKSSTYMSVADAVWNVEALFNLSYACPDESYGRTVTRDTTLYLPVCSNDSVSISDLTAFYGRMFDAVQAIYQSVDLDNKQFLILDVEAGGRNGSLQTMKLNALQGSVAASPDASPAPRDNPFPDGVLWYYGENGGCIVDDTIHLFHNVMDAADTLSRLLNANLVQVAPEGWQYLYTDIRMKELDIDEHCLYFNSPIPGVGSYCEFYKENPTSDDYWMSPAQMNYHYNGECYLVQNYFRNNVDVPIPSIYHLFQVSIEDWKLTCNPNAILHHTQAWYGFRIAISPGINPGDDPIIGD